MNRWLLSLLIFSLLVAILPVKSPCTNTIISVVTPLVLLVAVGHGGCCKIFGIWNNRLLSDPFWKIICGLLGWVITRAISLWPALFIEVALSTQLWQFVYGLIYDPPPEPLTFPLWWIFKSACFKSLLIDCSISTVYALVIEGWSWNFYSPAASSHRF